MRARDIRRRLPLITCTSIINFIKTQRSPGDSKVRFEVPIRAGLRQAFGLPPFRPDGWTPLNSHAGNHDRPAGRTAISGRPRLEGVRKPWNKTHGARERTFGRRLGSDGCALLTNTIAVHMDPDPTERTFARLPAARNLVVVCAGAWRRRRRETSLRAGVWRSLLHWRRGLDRRRLEGDHDFAESD